MASTTALVCFSFALLVVLVDSGEIAVPCTSRRRASPTNVLCGDGVEEARNCARWSFCDVHPEDAYPATCCCLRTVQECPEDLCCGRSCPNYPEATCVVDSCNLCQARFYVGREEVTEQCCPEGYFARGGLCYERFCEGRQVGDSCGRRRPVPNFCMKKDGFVRCMPMEMGSGSGDGGVADDQEDCDAWHG